jgi:hypothetical protein
MEKENKETNNVNPSNTIGNYMIVVKDKDGKVIRNIACVQSTISVMVLKDKSFSFDVR